LTWDRGQPTSSRRCGRSAAGRWSRRRAPCARTLRPALSRLSPAWNGRTGTSTTSPPTGA
jgi:hypothetical protein